MDVIDEIGYVATGPGPIPELTQDVPKEPIVITRMTLVIPDQQQADAAPDDEMPADE
jgi:hypothetical protein